MKIVVCIKQVPDTETRPKVAADGRSLDPADVNWVISPYDEYAVEEALLIKEKAGAGEVVVVTLGEERAANALRTALAMGADRAVHCKDDAFAGSDAAATGRVLAAAVKKLGGADLVLLGKHGVGDDNQQVGPILAEALGMPQVTVVVKLELKDGKAVAHREIEGGTEIVETSLPAVISAQKGLNEPRYASLKGIMAAKKKPLDVWNAGALDLSPDAVGARGSLTTVLKLELPPRRAEGKVLKTEPAEAARELARLLREEAKAI
jgi:electron transfer flavoprotein beta subunit